MQDNLRVQLEENGIKFVEGMIPEIAILVDPESNEIKEIGPNDLVPVLFQDDLAHLELGSISELFVGNVVIEGDPVHDGSYVPFFATIEKAAYLYCVLRGQPVTDQEFLRLYKLLKSKPDSRDRSKLFSFLQAAARLYMSLHPISKAEFRKVIGRLARSAKTFRMNKRSTNYFENALQKLG